MKITTLPILASLAALVALAGCATPEAVNSTAVTKALDLHKTDRFSVSVTDSSTTDTAFSAAMQKEASSELIDELEERGFDYVGARQPQIKAVFRTYPAVQASYLDASLPEKVTITTTEETRDADGSVTTTVSRTRSVPGPNASEPIYLPANSRIFLLDIYDVDSGILLWRGHLSQEDTSLNDEQLEDAIDTLVERLDEET
ncbi:hypothetical protein [Pelagicoccus sp. SDUM812005]|uniref:hypothetical protein n=1 Tax=Pelagicoccus sp. SDUM812005 TaxID=3041257 RepID=UPI00280D75FB|nr:hypothetical protein [Pelagicoccus sp. SDUM812005]MDQ8181050.1 hypothetical protein [Pelagicoccus sp. SDUM812005]